VRIVIALGGNALLERGQPMTVETQRTNVRRAVDAIAPLVGRHEIVITHGNGPQVGLLALQGAAYRPDEAYPLDVLGAETEGMIGYMIEQELRNLLPEEVALATLLTMVEVDANDPAFEQPTKFVGPVYAKADADRLAREEGWSFRQDGSHWRRVVASPFPKRILEIRPMEWLLARGTILICAGGGGVPTTYAPGAARKLVGVEAVIDKDLCSGVLAKALSADALVMLTDVDAVYLDWATPTQRPIRSAAPAALGAMHFEAGSMGPKVEAACRFTTETGGFAAIGALSDLGRIIAGEAGTTISTNASHITLG